MQIAGEGIEQLAVRVAPDQRLDHRRGVDDDHRRPACTAATTSSTVGPVDRSTAFSLATISAFVGRAAILASSAPTYPDSDIPSAAARSLSVSATSSETSRIYRVVMQGC